MSFELIGAGLLLGLYFFDRILSDRNDSKSKSELLEDEIIRVSADKKIIEVQVEELENTISESKNLSTQEKEQITNQITQKEQLIKDLTEKNSSLEQQLKENEDIA